MKREKWHIWKPVRETPTTLYSKELKDNYDGLTVSLATSMDSLFCILEFEIYLSYRVTDEGDLLKTLGEIENSECLGQSSLFTVENYLYIEWFCEQSYGMHNKSEITHYLIATPDDVIDILSIAKPRLTLYDAKSSG